MVSKVKPKKKIKLSVPQKIIDADLAKSSIASQDVNEKYEEEPNLPYVEKQQTDNQDTD